MLVVVVITGASAGGGGGGAGVGVFRMYLLRPKRSNLLGGG